MAAGKSPPTASLRAFKVSSGSGKDKKLHLSPRPGNLSCGCHTKLCQHLAESCKIAPPACVKTTPGARAHGTARPQPDEETQTLFPSVHPATLHP